MILQSKGSVSDGHLEEYMDRQTVRSGMPDPTILVGSGFIKTEQFQWNHCKFGVNGKQLQKLHVIEIKGKPTRDIVVITAEFSSWLNQFGWPWDWWLPVHVFISMVMNGSNHWFKV